MEKKKLTIHLWFPPGHLNQDLWSLVTHHNKSYNKGFASLVNTRQVESGLYLYSNIFNQSKAADLISQVFWAVGVCLQNHTQVDTLDWSNGKWFLLWTLEVMSSREGWEMK